MRFVAIGSVRRGAIDPPEPLDREGQWAASSRMQSDRERAMARRRGTYIFQLERDPQVMEEEIYGRRKPVSKSEQEKRTARMVERMRKCGVA